MSDETSERFPPLDPAPPEPPPPPPPARSRRPNGLYNLITVLFLLGTVGLVVYAGMIMADPYTPLNPLPPFTPLPIIISATPLPPTITPTPTPEPTATFTPIPSNTPLPEPPPFVLGGITYGPNENTCDWSAIAGTVQAETPLNGYTVRITGEGVDETLPLDAGAATGSFELVLGTTPLLAPYDVQIFQPGGLPGSEVVQVITSDQCDQNIVAVTFLPR